MADNAPLLNEIAGGLDALAAQVMSSTGEDRSFMEMWGWNMPGMNRQDLADYITRPKVAIQQLDPSAISDGDAARLAGFPARIQYARGEPVGNLPGGNAANSVAAFRGLIDSLNAIVEKYVQRPIDFEALESRKLLPAAQLRSLRNLAKGIERLTTENGTLAKKIDEINAAHSVAEALPADLQTLEDARKQYELADQRLRASNTEVDASRKRIDEAFGTLLAAQHEAERVLAVANRAYSASTSVGLGAAFSERARTLVISTYILGAVLVLTLGVGGYITYNRVEFVHKLMMTPNINFNILWINVTFTALSVSAPVWLAWLLTRQIGQRFRLAEDYGYKSAVAKAYEGYRAEAAQIDDALAKRLFSIALDVLSEAPLRLVEKDSPGSPMHEVGSPILNAFRKKRTNTKAAEPPEEAGE